MLSPSLVNQFLYIVYGHAHVGRGRRSSVNAHAYAESVKEGGAGLHPCIEVFPRPRNARRRVYFSLSYFHSSFSLAYMCI